MLLSSKHAISKSKDLATENKDTENKDTEKKKGQAKSKVIASSLTGFTPYFHELDD